jgi:16S rRNA (cytidine1402-2'-O)-methyltransferase
MSHLYLVPSPIGNLQDITLRALEALKNADLILAEDTRNSSRLLNHYQINRPLTPYHQHNEHKVAR